MAELVKSFLIFLSKLWNYIYVDLHFMIFFTGHVMHTIAWFPALYEKICYDLYDDSEICSTLSEYHDEEDSVQISAARWSTYIECVKFFPVILSAMFFGKFGDLYGVKIPILVSLMAIIVQCYFTMVGVSPEMQWPLYNLLISNFLTSFGGTHTVFISGHFTEVARITKDKSTLTLRYSVLAAFWSAGYLIAGIITPILLGFCSYQQIMLFGQIILTLDYLSILIFYQGHVEVEPTDQPLDKKKSEQIGSNSETKVSKFSGVKSLCVQLLAMYKEVLETLFKQRPNRKRVYIFIILIIGIVTAATDVGLDAILTLYVYRAPLSWGPDSYAIWTSVYTVVQLIGGVVAAFVLQRLKFTDLPTTMIGISSAVFRMIVIAVATKDWVMYLSIAAGSISNVGFAGIRSFMATLGEEHEVGSLMTMQMMTMGWSVLFGAAVCNNIYAATLSFYAGFSFAFIAVLLVVCILFLFGIYVDFKRKGLLKNDESEVKETTKL